MSELEPSWETDNVSPIEQKMTPENIVSNESTARRKKISDLARELIPELSDEDYDEIAGIADLMWEPNDLNVSADPSIANLDEEDVIGLLYTKAAEYGIEFSLVDAKLAQLDNDVEKETSLTPAERKMYAIKGDVIELKRRKEEGEINRKDFEFREIYELWNTSQPIQKKTVGDRAVVLTQSEFDQLGILEFIAFNGTLIELECNANRQPEDIPYILFPEDLGDL
jgi:hypothetical protein